MDDEFVRVARKDLVDAISTLAGFDGLLLAGMIEAEWLSPAAFPQLPGRGPTASGVLLAETEALIERLRGAL